MKRHTCIERAKKALILGVVVLYFIINPPNSASLCMGSNDAHAGNSGTTAKYQAAINRIKTHQLAAGSVVSEHVNIKRNGYTTVKILEIPEHQLSDLIEQWEKLGNPIDENTIHRDEFILFLINNANVRSISYMAKVPRFFFLVKKELAEPVLYGGEITKFWKTLTFPGWLKIAGALDAQGNYTEGFEHLGTEKDNIINIFKSVLSNTVKGSYTIVELYTDEKGERKGLFKFFKTCDQSMPTFVQSIDVMAAFGLTYMNLVPENPEDIGVKEDLTKPIVEKLITKFEVSRDALVLLKENNKKRFYPDS